VSDGLTVITPTGGRTQAFSLCQKYVLGQDFDSYIQWIVVDDCIPETKTAARTVLHPRAKWSTGLNTQARNLLEAFPYIQCDKILIMEDDDWYSRSYISTMARVLDDHLLAGCETTNYYHVPRHLYRINEHKNHSSLCSTGFHREMLPLLRHVCSESPFHSIDSRFWYRALYQHRIQPGYLPRPMCCGMKGLPGRPGIGMGHRPENGNGWMEDNNLQILKSWVGDSWIDYKEFIDA